MFQDHLKNDKSADTEKSTHTNKYRNIHIFWFHLFCSSERKLFVLLEDILSFASVPRCDPAASDALFAPRHDCATLMTQLDFLYNFIKYKYKDNFKYKYKHNINIQIQK